MSRRRLAATVIASIVTLGLSGCFGRGGDEQGGSSGAISVWVFPQGDDEVANNAFEAEFEEGRSECRGGSDGSA